MAHDMALEWPRLQSALRPLVAVARAQRPLAIEAGDIIITGGQLFDGVADTLRPTRAWSSATASSWKWAPILTGRDLTAAEVVRLQSDETVLPGPLRPACALRRGSVSTHSASTSTRRTR